MKLKDSGVLNAHTKERKNTYWKGMTWNIGLWMRTKLSNVSIVPTNPYAKVAWKGMSRYTNQTAVLMGTDSFTIKILNQHTAGNILVMKSIQKSTFFQSMEGNWGSKCYENLLCAEFKEARSRLERISSLKRIWAYERIFSEICLWKSLKNHGRYSPE